MSTGDLLNNARRLVRYLRQVNYRDEVDTESLSLGNPSAFLRILHHVLLRFSLPLSNYFSSQGFELFAKSDIRFMQEAYKVFRNELKYQPRLTVTQFLNDGFAERKIMMMCDVIQLCLEKNYELMRKPLKVLDKNSSSLCSWSQMYGRGNIAHKESLKQFDGEAKSKKKMYRLHLVGSAKPMQINGEDTCFSTQGLTMASHPLVAPNSTSDVGHCDDDMTTVSYSVQRHYSKRAGTLTSPTKSQESTQELHHNESAIDRLRVQDLERQIQTIETSELLQSHAAPNSSVAGSVSVCNVRRCRSPSLESGDDYVKHRVLDDCSMLEPPMRDAMGDMFAYRKCSQLQGTTTDALECCKDDQQSSYFHAAPASAIHITSNGQHLTCTGGEDVVHVSKVSVTTQGTQTDYCAESGDQQLVSMKVNHLAQRLLTLEARLTLTETKMNMLETRQDQAS